MTIVVRIMFQRQPRLRHAIFVFQAEDGIRDADVTGVQTCALPITTSVPSRWTPTCAWAPRIGRAAEGHPARAVDANDQEARRLLGEVYEGSDDGAAPLTAVEGRMHLNRRRPRVHVYLCTALFGF